MTRVTYKPTAIPAFFNRDEFLTPFDRLFDKVMENQFPNFTEDNVLTITGDKHNFEDGDGAKVIRRELKHSSFKRSFQLGDQLDGNSVSARFEDGILSVSIPKTEPEKPKKKFVKIS